MKSPSKLIEFPLENKFVNENTKEEAIKQLGLNPDKIHIVNVGLWTPGKNQAEGIWKI